MNVVAIQKALQNFVVACTGLPSNHVVWGGQQAPRTTQPGIVMRLMFIQDNGMPWVDAEPNTLTITPLAITSVVSDVFTTATAHGRTTGDGPFLLTGSTTKYWLIVTSTTTFKLATSHVNAINDVTATYPDTGSGVLTMTSTSETLAQGAEINFVQRSLLKATLTLQCFAAVGTGNDMAEATLLRINSKRLLPSIKAILESANIGVIGVDRVRTLNGSQDWVLFEPRSIVDIQLHLVSEETETGGSIETTEITNEGTEGTFTVSGA